MVQAVPFHCSTSVEVELAPWLFPTATQKAAPLHDTPCSVLATVPIGAGAVTIAHDVPFHCSTRGTVAVAVVCEPTATQLVLETQVTPWSCAGVVARGATLGGQ